MVAAVHSVNLRKHNVALVNEKKKVIGEIVKKRKRRRAGLSSAHNPRIILNSLTEARLLKHLDVVHRPLANSLSFKKLPLLFKVSNSLNHLVVNLVYRLLELLLTYNVKRSGINRRVAEIALNLARQRVNLAYPVNLIAEKFNTNRLAAAPCRENFNGVAADSELVSDEINVVSLILNFNKLVNQLVALLGHTLAKRNNHILIINGVAY